ncbi:MAG: hypothetical protein JF621_27705 [Streptomyces turgidiscabies]|nr:hypothetical protein [Streptomyces turgidiscabies]
MSDTRHAAETADPRALQLAQHRQRIAHDGLDEVTSWYALSKADRDLMLAEARDWLRAAVEAGIAPMAERPTDKHDAVWVDDEGFLYGEYRTAPESGSIVRLVWASEMAESKQEMEDRGAEFRLIGWST